jgi:transposase-like protein
MEHLEQPPAPDAGVTPATRRLECPWCESTDVEPVGALGSHLMVAQYICRDCHSPFERIRQRGDE